MTRRAEPSDAGTLRTVPEQDRSRRTVAAILEAASDLLSEGGPDALTTSALAERTGLLVRNVYRYFSDRQAVMATLAERMNERIESAVAEVTALADPAHYLERAIDELIDGVIAATASEPAAAQVRAAMRTSRQLQVLDRASDERIARQLADLVQQRGVRTQRHRLEAGMFVLATCVGAVLDRATLDSGASDGVAEVRETKRMAAAYLRTLI